MADVVNVPTLPNLDDCNQRTYADVITHAIVSISRAACLVPPNRVWPNEAFSLAQIQGQVLIYWPTAVGDKHVPRVWHRLRDVPRLTSQMTSLLRSRQRVIFVRLRYNRLESLYFLFGETLYVFHGWVMVNRMQHGMVFTMQNGLAHWLYSLCYRCVCSDQNRHVIMLCWVVHKRRQWAAIGCFP